MHRSTRLRALILASTLLLGAAPPAHLYGFLPANSGPELAVEARFLPVPSAQGAIDTSKVLGDRPHYAGSPADHALAEYARERFAAFGLNARVEAFDTVVDTPQRIELGLYPDGRTRGARSIGFDLREKGDPIDPPTTDPTVGFPFNAGAADGDVTAPLVYAHRGLPADYAVLHDAGVDVRGAIALVRYGAAFRGLLAQYAQTAGAAGMILYDDPAEDGFARGPVYPNGPWRPAASIQRGSVGDGIRIPVIPISADNALTLLRSLRGPNGPAGWAGALDAPYPLSKGPGIVHLVVELNRREETLWNTVATIAGSEPTQSVVLGAHRDAWVAGVGDNGDGTSVMLEVARGLGELAKSGWKPKRTITIALWDGEEIGLRGSADFAHVHARALRAGCVAYLNADENVTGPSFGAESVGALDAVLADATHDVAGLAGVTPRSIGGGSDHESFLFSLGTPVAEAGFHGPFGPYHSSYDTLRYAQTESDPGFARHRTVAQLYGVLALRLADADAVPYGFAGYGEQLDRGEQLTAAAAAKAGLRFDDGGLRTAIGVYATLAVRADAAIGDGGGPGAAAELSAAQQLDRLAYGVNGYAAVAFPDAQRAIAAHDQTALDAAVTQARETIERAGATITPG
ncbi:MAG TPA: M28 family peptidase [Candidatus Elarobacter sp.]|nr:M28 family peptidase [Candidatus Elarobacter sp.]